MSRIITDQVNIWGKQQGADVQRSDLWVVDFTQALSGLSSVSINGLPMTPGLAVPFVPPKLATYFARSVALPDLKLKSEPIRRDSRSYPMPSWDEPLDGIRMIFLLDCFRAGGSSVNPYRSDIYQMLDVWRAVVRAGRGSMSQEFAITLDGNYRIDFAYDVRVMMLRPSSNPTASKTTAGAITGLLAGVAGSAISASSIMNDLEFSLRLRLVNCWLGSFRLSELNYEGAKMVQIEALFYADDVLQDTATAQ